MGGLDLPTKWSFNQNPSVVQGQSYGRAVPDVSTDADPYSGYLLYSPAFLQGGTPALEGGWGGTSFVGPQLNGVTAVFESSLGHRVGFWNPAIYGFAQAANSPFTPLQTSGTSSDNLYYTGTPGALYNEGVGLGTPKLQRAGQGLRFVLIGRGGGPGGSRPPLPSGPTAWSALAGR